VVQRINGGCQPMQRRLPSREPRAATGHEARGLCRTQAVCAALSCGSGASNTRSARSSRRERRRTRLGHSASAKRRIPADLGRRT
jgi:hypothetical protein